MVREYSAALQEKSLESSEWQQRLADALADVKDLEVRESSLALVAKDVNIALELESVTHQLDGVG